MATAFLVFIILAYLLAIRKTVQTYETNKQLTQNIAIARNAPNSINKLEKKINEWDDYLLTDCTLNEIQLKIFDQLSKVCNIHNVNLENLNKINSVNKNDIFIETYEVSIKGNFSNLLQAQHELERKTKFAIIVSANYRIVKNRKTKEEELILNLYLQSALKPKLI